MRLLLPTILVEMFLHSCWAQDLAPRAYLITPLHSNAINLTYSYYHGGLDFNGVVPVTGANLQRAYFQRLSFLQLLRPLRQHRSVAALRRRNISGVCAWHRQANLPFRPVRFRTSRFRESEGWPRDAHFAVREVEAKGSVGREPESTRPDRPV